MWIFKELPLRDFRVRYADAEKPLRLWIHDCKAAQWKSVAEVKAYARSADYVGNQRWVFNVDLLGTLLEDYEHMHHPELAEDTLQNVTPIDAIRWAMDRHGLMQKDLSPSIGSPQLVSAVMNGNRALSKTMIVNLHDGLGIPYEQLLRAPAKSRYRKVAMF